MKNIKLLLLLLLVINFTSCNKDTEDIVTGDAVEGGALLKIMPSIGKALGSPLNIDDIENTEFDFNDVNLDLTIQLQFGGTDVTKYEIVKTFLRNGDELPGAESVVASGTTLPLNVNYTTIEEYMAGTEETDASNLRMGDQFIFKTKMYTSSGVHYAIESTYIVNVACASNLAGNYSNPDVPSNAAGQATFIEIGTGTYRISAMPFLGWGGADPIYIDIIDSCGIISVVGSEIGVPIDGSGTVDQTTGVVTFAYTVYHSDGSVWFDLPASTYTPIP